MSPHVLAVDPTVHLSRCPRARESTRNSLAAPPPETRFRWSQRRNTPRLAARERIALSLFWSTLRLQISARFSAFFSAGPPPAPVPRRRPFAVTAAVTSQYRVPARSDPPRPASAPAPTLSCPRSNPSCRMHAVAVAPVVRTSSTSSTSPGRPATAGTPGRIMPRTASARADTDDPASRGPCARPSQRHIRAPTASATARPSTPAWSNP